MEENWIMKLILAAFGIYFLYLAMQMKISREIPQMLVGKKFLMSTAKNPEGFIQKTFLPTFGIGMLFFIIGLLGIFGISTAFPIIDVGLLVALLVAVIYYGKFLLKAQRKYLVGVEDTK